MMLPHRACSRLAGGFISAHRGYPKSILCTRIYHQRVLEHYENPRNVGSLDKNDPNVGTALVGSPACGDVMKLQILVDDKTGIIKDAKFKTFGCGSAIASSSYATTILKGTTVEEAAKVEDKAIAKYLSLPPVKLHCSMLAEDAVKSAIKDWASKKAGRSPQNDNADCGHMENAEEKNTMAANES